MKKKYLFLFILLPFIIFAQDRNTINLTRDTEFDKKTTLCDGEGKITVEDFINESVCQDSKKKTDKQNEIQKERAKAEKERRRLEEEELTRAELEKRNSDSSNNFKPSEKWVLLANVKPESPCDK